MPAQGEHRPPHLGTEKGSTALPASEDAGLAKLHGHERPAVRGVRRQHPRYGPQWVAVPPELPRCGR